MPDPLADYIKDMQAKGYSISAIKATLLKYYPPEKVEKALADANSFSDYAPHTHKLMGMLFHPHKVFAAVKEEDMIRPFYLSAILTLISLGLSAIYLFMGVGIEKALPFPMPIAISSTFISTYFAFLFIMSLLIPFAYVAYYYLFLKVIFSFSKGYDAAYKSIAYSLIQMQLLVLIMLPISYLLVSYVRGISINIIGGIALIILLYNIVTKIIGLKELCEVKTYQAIIPVLLPWIILIMVFFALQSIIGPSFTQLGALS